MTTSVTNLQFWANLMVKSSGALKKRPNFWILDLWVRLKKLDIECPVSTIQGALGALQHKIYIHFQALKKYSADK